MACALNTAIGASPIKAVWIYDRVICSGLGDRLGAMLTVAALASVSNVKVEMEWCSSEKSRVHGNVHAFIPQWTGFNYSLSEFKSKFQIPFNIEIVDHFTDKTRPSVSFTGNELAAEEGLDQVYTTASRTTRLLKPTHPLDFIRAYHVVGSQFAERHPTNLSAPYVVLHVRAPGHNSYAPRYERDLSMFCTLKILRKTLALGHTILVISDDLSFARAALSPYNETETLVFTNGTAFEDMGLLLNAIGIIQHAPTGYSSYSNVPSMARGIPLINTYLGQDHRYSILDKVPDEFYTCYERKQFVRRLMGRIGLV